MPVGPTKTKAQKQAVVGTEMHKFKHGELHSGSKHGPVVKNRKQAIAIAMHESHQAKPAPPHYSVKKHGFEPFPDGAVNQHADEQMLDGVDPVARPHISPNYAPKMGPYPAPAKNAQSFGHSIAQRHGHLRLSGHSGAHQLGRKK